MATLNSQYLSAQLEQVTDLTEDSNLLVAYSGGIDSTVLLHLLAEMRDFFCFQLTALHVNHGVATESDSWEQHCSNFCKALNVPFSPIRLRLGGDKNVSEQTMRGARYRWFEQQMQRNDILLTAHQQNDQTETFFLNLMRGAGIRGLSAIQLSRPFAGGKLIRPLLQISREAIEDYAKQNELRFLEDPSNLDLNYKRNFLRHVTIENLQQKWPKAVQHISQSVEILSETRSILHDVAKADVDCCVSKGSGFLSIGDQLSIVKLKQLSKARQINLLRYWTRQQCGVEPTRSALNQFIDQAFQSNKRHIQLRFGDYCIFRYQNNVYLTSNNRLHQRRPVEWDMTKPLELNEIGLKLIPKATHERGLSLERLQRKVSVRFREGGERIRLLGRNHSSSLKKLFQEHSIPPWERGDLPLIYCDDELVSVVPWLVDASFCAQKGESGVSIDLEIDHFGDVTNVSNE